MVGSGLMQRTLDEGDFATINPVLFSTSNAGGAVPAVAGAAAGAACKREDAFWIDAASALRRLDHRPGPDQPTCTQVVAGWSTIGLDSEHRRVVDAAAIAERIRLRPRTARFSNVWIDVVYSTARRSDTWTAHH